MNRTSTTITAAAVFAAGVLGVTTIAATAAAVGNDGGRAAAPAAQLAVAADAHAGHARTAAAQPVAADGADPLESYAGAYPAGADPEALAAQHDPYDATLPPAPAGDVANVQLTLKDRVIEIAPGVRYRA